MDDKKYVYAMTLTFARPGSAFSEEELAELVKGIAAYNERSIFMANQKTIELEEVADNHIKLQLTSSQALTSPGRGLRTLTSILIQDPSSCFRARLTPGGQLFRVADIQQPSAENAPASYTAFSDADLVKAILDYLLVEKKDGSSSSQKKRAAMEEMKKAAVAAGMLH